MSVKRTTQEPESLEDIVSSKELDDSEVTRAMRAKMGWREWLAKDYARYWYVALVLLADLFLMMEISRIYQVDDVLGLSFLLVAFILLLCGAWVLYKRIWPRSPFSGPSESEEDD